MRSSSTTTAWPGRAIAAAASAAKRRSAAPAQAIPGGADRGERALERGLDAAVEPLHPARVEVEAAGLDRLDREAAVLEPLGASSPTPVRPRPGRARRATSDGQVASASPEPHARPDAGSLGGGGDGPEQRLGSRHRRERRRAAARPAAGSRSAAWSSNPGMRMQAIIRTYVLHEHTFSCQGGNIIMVTT